MAPTINQASRRLYLARSIIHLSRELVLDDGFGRMHRNNIASYLDELLRLVRLPSEDAVALRTLALECTHVSVECAKMALEGAKTGVLGRLTYPSNDVFSVDKDGARMRSCSAVAGKTWSRQTASMCRVKMYGF